MDKLMKLKDDESFNVRHAFIWACENIATSNPDLFCDKLDIFYEMISDSEDKVRIEAPEDENRIVRIHSAGAIRITKKALEQ